jgi:hypothetical protein
MLFNIPPIISNRLSVEKEGGSFTGWIDCLVHLAVWITVLALGHWPLSSSLESLDPEAKELMYAAWITTWISFISILVVAAWQTADGPHESNQPTWIVAVVTGSLAASIIFTLFGSWCHTDTGLTTVNMKSYHTHNIYILVLKLYLYSYLQEQHNFSRQNYQDTKGKQYGAGQ